MEKESHVKCYLCDGIGIRNIAMMSCLRCDGKGYVHWTYELHTGDEVTWNDPDEGKCTRTLVIQRIERRGHVLKIFDKDGGYLECLASELS